VGCPYTGVVVCRPVRVRVTVKGKAHHVEARERVELAARVWLRRAQCARLLAASFF
jgi:hypothetical protein